MNWAKFHVLFNITEHDNWDILSKRVEEYSHTFTVDEWLTILVNIAHSLHSNTVELFQIANQEFATRFVKQYNPEDHQLLVTPADIPKIITTLTEYNKLEIELTQFIAKYLSDKKMFLNYSDLTKIIPVYATLVEIDIKNEFFREFHLKIMKDIGYIDG